MRHGRTRRRCRSTRPSAAAGHVDRERMPRLVDLDLHAARQCRDHDDTVAVILWLPVDGDTFRAQIFYRRVNVVADERELVLGRFGASNLGGMDAELRWRQREDQPSLSGIDMPEAEDVPQHGSKRVGLRCVNQCVCTDDGHAKPLFESFMWTRDDQDTARGWKPAGTT